MQLCTFKRLFGERGGRYLKPLYVCAPLEATMWGRGNKFESKPDSALMSERPISDTVFGTEGALTTTSRSISPLMRGEEPHLEEGGRHVNGPSLIVL